MGEFVGKRVVPDHVGVWDQKKTYEPLMIVLDGETGDSYISRKAVPVGISLADESYWSLCAHYSAQMRKLEQDVEEDVQQMHSDVTAVKNAMSQEFQETHTSISKELDDTHKAISQELSETEQRVNENLEQTSSELTGKVEQAKSDLNTRPAGTEGCQGYAEQTDGQHCRGKDLGCGNSGCSCGCGRQHA